MSCQTQDTIPHPVTVYRHRADLSLCYPLMWNVTLEYTSTHFNILGQTLSGNPSATFHSHQRKLTLMMLVVSKRLSKKSTIPAESWTVGPVVCESIMLSARPQLLLISRQTLLLSWTTMSSMLQYDSC